jgi:anti-sigma28 factor (negative regulator of flagellin synthesis)
MKIYYTIDNIKEGVFMKINNNNINPILPSGVRKKGNYTFEQATKTASSDRVDVNTKTIKSDGEFIQTLKTNIMAELNRGISKDEKEKLKLQIFSGEYDINPADIARKMFLD